MDQLILREPTPDDRDAVMDYWAEYQAAGDEPNGLGGLESAAGYDDYLARLHRLSKAESCPPGFVPATQYLAIRQRDGRLVGMLNLRHSLNDHLLEVGGHVGYSVRASQRGHGYAAQMVELVKPAARALGLSRLLITCNRENLASARTIEKAGGVLEDERWDAQDGHWTRRYWLVL